jgi:hypothetical protein
VRAAGLIVLTALALAASPAVAQKTKTSAAIPAALAALETCEIFAKGDVLALEAAAEAGWDAYEETAESPFIRSYSASRDYAGFGYADMFSLVETYPTQTLGYCRIDLNEPIGNGAAVIAAIAELDRYEGEVTTNDEGDFASLAGENSLLMTLWNEYSFVIQLTILTPKNATASE